MAARRKSKAYKAAMAMITEEYDLQTKVAQDLAHAIAVNRQLLQDADDEIAITGLICRAGKNGAPYANPSVSIRVKLSELIERQLARLERYKKQDVVQPLSLDDEGTV